MENLSVMWRQFSLSESEGKDFVIQEPVTVEEVYIAARFFTGRVLNMEAIARTFKLLWRTQKWFEVRDMGDHRVVFVFTDASDAEKVLMGEPWTFDKHLVTMKRIEKHTDVRALPLELTHFWVQVHDLPIGLAPSVAKQIVQIVGTMDEDGVELEESTFQRYRVEVDISKPLCRGRKITLNNGSNWWVSFKYERLPNICYWCGKLTHSDRECPVWLKSRKALKEED